MRIGSATLPPGSKVPAAWRLEGSTLRVLDPHERLCWEKHFGAFDPVYPYLVADKVLIADIDNDGQVEVGSSYYEIRLDLETKDVLVYLLYRRYA